MLQSGLLFQQGDFFPFSVLSLHFVGLPILSPALKQNLPTVEELRAVVAAGAWWEKKISFKYGKEAGHLQINLMSPVFMVGGTEAVWLKTPGFTFPTDFMLFPSSVQVFSPQSRVMRSDQPETLNCL